MSLAGVVDDSLTLPSAVVLLPWNTLIISSSYLALRVRGSGFETTFRSWVSLSITVTNLVSLALANLTQHHANFTARIAMSIAVITGVLGVYAYSTTVESIDPSLFFSFVMCSSVVLGASASTLDNASVGIASKLGGRYLQAVLSGQGAIAFFIALVQFIAAYVAEERVLEDEPVLLKRSLLDSTDDFSITSLSSQSASAFSFFLSNIAFLLFAFLAAQLLFHLPIYRAIKSRPEADESSSKTTKKASIRVVAKKIKHLGWSIFWVGRPLSSESRTDEEQVYVITIAVFPSVTSTITSVHAGASRSSDGIFAKLCTDALYIPLGFIIYATGDWIGRTLPQIDALRIVDWRALAAVSIARTGFIVSSPLD